MTSELQQSAGRRVPTATGERRVRHGVFVGYSHRDRDILGELQVRLKPLQRAWLLDLWDDSRVMPGARGREALRAALDAAERVVLLLSPGFFNSAFVTAHQLPAMLGTRQRHEVLCLYARPSTEVFENFLYRDDAGVARQVRMIDFHPLNEPVRPLAAVEPSVRAGMMAEAGSEIIKTIRPDLVTMV